MSGQGSMEPWHFKFHAVACMQERGRLLEMVSARLDLVHVCKWLHTAAQHVASVDMDTDTSQPCLAYVPQRNTLSPTRAVRTQNSHYASRGQRLQSCMPGSVTDSLGVTLAVVNVCA